MIELDTVGVGVKDQSQWLSNSEGTNSLNSEPENVQN